MQQIKGLEPHGDRGPQVEHAGGGGQQDRCRVQILVVVHVLDLHQQLLAVPPGRARETLGFVDVPFQLAAVLGIGTDVCAPS